jgi:heptaprenyl diphosphate synthase
VKWGNHASVLTGDYLFAKAFSIVAEQGTPQMLKVLTDVVCSMCEGEILQLKSIFNPEQSEADYQMRIGKKTADFLAASCKLGGMSAGFTEPEILSLQEYGHSVGMAFQITDDILDMTQPSLKLGKPSGNDLRQGVLTIPVLYALKESPYRDELKKLIVLKDMSKENLERGLEIILSTDAIEYSYNQVQQYLDQARSVLPASIDADLCGKLSLIADFIAERRC